LLFSFVGDFDMILNSFSRLKDAWMGEDIRKLFEESASLTTRAGEHLTGRIRQAAEIMAAACRSGNTIFNFGNGGSAADAQHISAELVGRFRRERRALRAEALTTDTSALTAIANDYGFERVFARQLEGKGRAGDVAVAISTSGVSPNILAALETARQLGMKCIVLTGQGGGKSASPADVLLDVPSTDTPRIQEAHVVIYHALCELVESALVR